MNEALVTEDLEPCQQLAMGVGFIQPLTADEAGCLSEDGKPLQCWNPFQCQIPAGVMVQYRVSDIGCVLVTADCGKAR